MKNLSPFFIKTIIVVVLFAIISVLYSLIRERLLEKNAAQRIVENLVGASKAYQSGELNASKSMISNTLLTMEIIKDDVELDVSQTLKKSMENLINIQRALEKNNMAIDSMNQIFASTLGSLSTTEIYKADDQLINGNISASMYSLMEAHKYLTGTASLLNSNDVLPYREMQENIDSLLSAIDSGIDYDKQLQLLRSSTDNLKSVGLTQSKNR